MFGKSQPRIWAAVFVMGLLVPCMHSQTTAPSPSSPTTTTDVVSGTDPEPISPSLIDMLWIVVGML